MTEQEIRRALEKYEALIERGAKIQTYTDSEENDWALEALAFDEQTGYAATVRALLDARALLKLMADRYSTAAVSFCECSDCQLDRKVRAFLAERESK